MTIAGQAVHGKTQPPASIVERLRDAGYWPIFSIVGVTSLSFGVVYALDISRLWLVAGVLLGGAAVLLFFTSGSGWRFSTQGVLAVVTRRLGGKP